MTIVKPNVEMLKEKDPFKKIETIGRVCYKSEDKIADGTDKKFVANIIKSQHHAMLEHVAFVFEVDMATYIASMACKFLNSTRNQECERMLVSGNLRAVRESGIQALINAVYVKYPELVEDIRNEEVSSKGSATIVDFEKIDNKDIDEIYSHRYTTMKFVTDRGVSHELVRHRRFSFAQESTRYVNYSKDRFGGGDIKFVEPAGYSSWPQERKDTFEHFLSVAEKTYNTLVSSGATAQEARAVLPNAVKTEIFVTGDGYEWDHFFKLRSLGVTGAPHPDMKIVADKALELYW